MITSLYENNIYSCLIINLMIALFIGRFQPFHKGHLWAVKFILRNCEKIIIGIGSSQYAKTATNPYSAKERREMICRTLDSEDITNYAIFEIPDIHNDHEWVEHVKRIIPHMDIVYTGSLLSKQLFTERGCIVKSIPRHKNISASEVRLRIMKGLDWMEIVPEPVQQVIQDIGRQRILA